VVDNLEAVFGGRKKGQSLVVRKYDELTLFTAASTTTPDQQINNFF